MRVVFNQNNQDVQTALNLEPQEIFLEKIYIPLGINIFISEAPTVYLHIQPGETEHEDEEEVSPHFYPIEWVKILDNFMPSSWEISVETHSNGLSILIQPEKWHQRYWKNKHSFLEAFFDNDTEALKVFREERDRIYTECSNHD
ncbi:MAG: hypothetical protein ACO1RX_08575 [Candidatus Sericytochromatia bacterium]